LAHASAWSYPSGDADGAAAAVPVCEALAEASSPFGPGAVGWALQTVFWTNLDAGRLDRARAAADAALAAAAEADLSILASRMAVNRARMAIVEGDLDGAWSHAENAVRVARASGETFVAAVATQLMADVAARRGDVSVARDLLASVIDDVAESMTQRDADAIVGRIAELAS
jgi:hypothetical protein